MEAEIRSRLAAGEYRSAFELLLDCFQDKVFRLCCALLHDEALAQDTAQDVFLRIWKSLPGFHGESSVSTWVYAVARNACLSRLKSEAARRGVPLAEAAEPTRNPTADGLDLRAALARLPEKYRQVLLLFYYEQKSYEEVAAMLGLPLGTVKTHLHRAKKLLAAEMEVCCGVRRV